MSEQSRGGKLNVFVNWMTRYRIYSVLAAHAEADLPVEDALSALADAYGTSDEDADREISTLLRKVAASVADNRGIGTSLIGTFRGLLPEEIVILAAADGSRAVAAKALTRAADLLAFSEARVNKGGAR